MRRLWSLGAALLGGTDGPPREHEVGGRRLIEERPLSEGGFSFVVQVRDVDSGDVFALKKILCQDGEGFATAQREVEVLENLPSHKNIVGYFGHAVVGQAERGAAHREVLILLELCTGGHLLDLIDRHSGLLPEQDLLQAFTDIAEAVFCLHSHTPPIQHRDLKLENVLRGDDGFWKVCDFGSWSNEPLDLTSATAKQLTSLSEELGRYTTMMYRPPEVVDVYSRFPISCAVDMWMLGCILFALMYNRHPFQDAAALAIRNGQYSLPAREAPVSPKLLDLLVWLLALDPRDRPSARKLVTVLWQWQDLNALELPEPVVERRERLVKSTTAARESQRALREISLKEMARAPGQTSMEAGRRGHGSGHRAPERGAPGRGRAGGADDSVVAAAAANPVDAAAFAAEPWVAFADDNSSPARRPTGGADVAQDDWAFCGFQNATPEVPEAAPRGTPDLSQGGATPSSRAPAAAAPVQPEEAGGSAQEAFHTAHQPAVCGALASQVQSTEASTSAAEAGVESEGAGASTALAVKTADPPPLVSDLLDQVPSGQASAGAVEAQARFEEASASAEEAASIANQPSTDGALASHVPAGEAASSAAEARAQSEDVIAHAVEVAGAADPPLPESAPESQVPPPGEAVSSAAGARAQPDGVVANAVEAAGAADPPLPESALEAQVQSGEAGVHATQAASMADQPAGDSSLAVPAQVAEAYVEGVHGAGASAGGFTDIDDSAIE